MAENVIRQDVVEISYKTETEALDELNKTLDEINSCANGLDLDDPFVELDRTLKPLTSNLVEIDTAFDGVNTDAAKFGTTISEFENAAEPIEKTNREAEKLDETLNNLGDSKGVQAVKADMEAFDNIVKPLKTRIDTLKTALQGLPSSPAKLVGSAFESAKNSVNQFTTSIKTAAKTKFDGVKSSISGVKTEFVNVTKTLSESEKGAKGFVNTLKNMGKISVVELKKGVTSIGDGLKKVPSLAAKGASKIKTFAATKLTGLYSGLKSIEAKLDAIGKKAVSVAAAGLKKLGSIGKAAVVGISAGVVALGTATGAAVTQSVKAYADYEQLVGGVETLFKDSAGTVQAYANDAYKTAGLSANDYMETVTGFSASLLSSLGGDTKKAAEYANLAITDMADNANKMGSDMESIQNAYQGFAKQNYTMLDNLKLGYGGTQAEMQRLVADAAKIDKSIDANSMSYGNIVKAIHAVQTNMDITGTTAKEAATTISGSLASMQSAWGNLLTALAIGGDPLDQCIDNMIDSVKTFGSNLLPVAARAFNGLITAAKEILPKAKPYLKSGFLKVLQVVQEAIPVVLPSLISGGAMIIQTLVSAIISHKDEILSTICTIGSEIIKSLYEGIKGEPMSDDTFNQLVDTLESVKQKFVDVVTFVKDNFSTIASVVKGVTVAIIAFKAVMIAVNAVIAINTALTKAKQAADMIASVAQKVVNADIWASIPALAAQAAALMANPVTWIVLAVVVALAALIAIVVLVVKHWDELKVAWNSFTDCVAERIGEIVDWFVSIKDKIVSVFSSVTDYVAEKIGEVINWFKSVIDWIKSNWQGLLLLLVNPFAGIFKLLYDNCEGFRNKVNSVVTAIVNGIKNVFSTVVNWINTNIIQPITNLVTNIIYFIVGLATLLFDKIKSILAPIIQFIVANIITPIKTAVSNFIDGVKALFVAFVNGVINLWNKFKTGVVNIVTAVKNFFVTAWSVICAWVNTNVIQPIINAWNWLKTTVSNIITGVKEWIVNAWGVICDWVQAFIIMPIVTYWNWLKTTVSNIITGVKDWIVAVWGVICNWVNSYIIQPIISYWNWLYNTVLSIISGVKNTFVSIWGTLSSFVSSKIVTPISTFFTNLWNKIKTGVTSVKTAIVNAFTNAVNSVKAAWNGVVDFFKGIWDKIKNTVTTIINKGKEALGVSTDVQASDGGTKHAFGGIMTTRHIGTVAEAGAEAIIPLSHDKRKRAIDLFGQTGKILGFGKDDKDEDDDEPKPFKLPKYTPDDNPVSTVSKISNENNTYSPSLTINVNGRDKTDKQLAKMVRKEATEAFGDLMDRMSDKYKPVREV